MKKPQLKLVRPSHKGSDDGLLPPGLHPKFSHIATVLGPIVGLAGILTAHYWIPASPSSSQAIPLTPADNSGHPTNTSAITTPPPIAPHNVSEPRSTAIPQSLPSPDDKPVQQAASVAATSGSVDLLKQALRKSPSDDVYLAALRGIKALPQAVTLSVDDALELLGGVRNSQSRKDLIIRAVFPRLSTPIQPVDAVRMLSALYGEDRSDVVEALAPCISRPITNQQHTDVIASSPPDRRLKLSALLDGPLSCHTTSATK